MNRLVLFLALACSACQWLQPPETSCTDGVLNGRETDLDCGGGCAPCAESRVCVVDGDCVSGVCAVNRCVAPSCADGVQNGDESDVDCGGSCAACRELAACAAPSDCEAGVCVNGRCPGPTCSDSQLNGDESDVDCGGSCTPCVDGRACELNVDCASGSCANAVCGNPCLAPLLACGGACVDRFVDRAHCGACGNACTAAQACVLGQCVSTCSGGTHPCGSACVDWNSDPANCGGCGNPCSAGQACIGGSCVVPCPVGQVACGSVCVSLDRDAQHCGGCNQPCPSGSACVMGQCSAGCVAPLQVCMSGPSACIDPRFDPDNCGGCGMPCAIPANGLPACLGSTCGLGACFPGFADCNGSATDGCESTLDTTAHCGRCDVACGGGDSCVAGACCTPGGSLPMGSYQTTCVDCAVCGPNLSCRCENAAQVLQNTSAVISSCPGGFANCNGVLQCDPC